MAINDDNTIAGSFIRSDGIEHGFVGPLNGTYTTFSDGNGTEAVGLSNTGYVVGFDPIVSCTSNCFEYIRSPHGKFTTITKDGTPLRGRSIGINKRNVLAGEYLDQNAKGYRGRNGRYIADIILQAAHTDLYPSAINDAGDIAGYFKQGGLEYGFVQSDSGESVIQFPSQSARSTVILGINNKGTVAGIWIDASNKDHPFYLDSKTGVFTEITIPGSESNVATGVNSSGLIALYTYPGGVSYIYCPRRPKKCPGSGIPVRETKFYAPPGRAVFPPATFR